MVVTRQHIKAIAPAVTEKALETFTGYINQYQGDVNTPLRMAAFLAQVLHESGCFKWVHELASGKEYEGRRDLGNIYPGDGEKFKGRGLLQITGRFNYVKISVDLFKDKDLLIKTPDVLATPENAVRSAYWFWNTHGLNTLADTGDFERITRRINGGLNGQAERLKYYEKALEVLMPEVKKPEQEADKKEV